MSVFDTSEILHWVQLRDGLWALPRHLHVEFLSFRLLSRGETAHTVSVSDACRGAADAREKAARVGRGFRDLRHVVSGWLSWSLTLQAGSLRWILLRGGQLTTARHPHEEFASFEFTHAGSRRMRIFVSCE